MGRRLATAAALGFALLAPAAEVVPRTLDLRHTLETSRGTYIEEAESHLRVLSARKETVVERRVTHELRFGMERTLPPGRYAVESFERACSPDCSLLDPPIGRCARRVRTRPGRGCWMTRHAFPARFPSAARVRAVRRFLRGRAGINSWALVDSWGRPRGFAPNRVYVSGSVVKAMLLAAYLRRVGNRMPDAGERTSLDPMITSSSNAAADAIYNRVGDAPLYEVARRAGMTRFSVAGYWANARFSAADQARLFRAIDRLVPRASRAYARRLLSSIVPWQRWGFSRFSLARGFRTFFKGGWRTTGAGWLVHEAALFERGDTRVSMAVLTDGNPSHEYGTETLRGVARRIFGGRPAAGAPGALPRPDARLRPP